MNIFVFTRLLYHGMIYNVSEFQEAKFQAFHKIFANKVGKYRLTGWSWSGPLKVSLLAEMVNIPQRHGKKGIHDILSFERWLLWDNPGKRFRRSRKSEIGIINACKGKNYKKAEKRSKILTHALNIYIFIYSLIHSFSVSCSFNTGDTLINKIEHSLLIKRMF